MQGLKFPWELLQAATEAEQSTEVPKPIFIPSISQKQFRKLMLISGSNQAQEFSMIFLSGTNPGEQALQDPEM